MTAHELDLYRRVNRVAQELRDGYGPMMNGNGKKLPAGMVCRGVVATRLVREVTDWIELYDAEKVSVSSFQCSGRRGSEEEGGEDE